MKKIITIIALLVSCSNTSAALTGWSSSNYLKRSSAVFDTYPFLISAWGNLSAHSSSRAAAVIGTENSADHTRGRIGTNASGNCNSVTRSTSSSVATTSTTAGTSAWFHCFGEFIATNSQASLLNGAGRGTDATSISPNASNSAYIGVNSAPDTSWEATGGVAEVSVWDGAGMTEGNMDSLSVKLAAGENPRNINAEVGQPWTAKLVAYWPLTSSSDLTDATGNGHDMSMIGTLTNFASHPTIDPVKLKRSVRTITTQ